MKKRRSRLQIYALALCMLLFGIAVSAQPARAAGRTGISGYVFGLDETDNPCAYSPAAALIDSQGECFIFSSLSPMTDATVNYVYISTEGNSYNLEMYALDNTLSVIQWSLVGGSPDTSFYSIDAPHENEVCSVYYLDESSNESTASATITGLQIRDNYAFITASDGPTSAYYPPAMVVNGDGNCVALATEGGIWGIFASEDTFYANSDDNSGTDNSGSGNDNSGTNNNGSGNDNQGTDNNGSGNDNSGTNNNGSGNDNQGTGNNGNESNKESSDKKSGGIQKYWWILLVGAGLIGGGIYFKKKQQKDETGSASQDVPLQEANPYLNQTPIQPASIQPNPIKTAPAPQPAPMQNSPGKVEEIGATAPYVPPMPAVAAPETKGTAVQGKKCKLSAVGGYMDGRIYPMDAREVTIGRDASASIRYPSDVKGVSRMHCKLYWQGNDLMLVDLESSFGTYVEGKGKLSPHTPVVLKEGDRFCIGEQRNMFVIKKA